MSVITRLQTAFRLSQTATQLTVGLPALLLAAEHVAAQLQMGMHGRRRVGQGESFWQFRRYQPGDDAAQIDWHMSARTPHVFIREQEWEAAQTLLLWVDHTGSMHWRSDKNHHTKHDRALILALAMARLALEAGEQVALLAMPQRRFRGKAALPALAHALLIPHEESYPAIMAVPRFATCLVFSDFLHPLPPWQQRFALWAERGCSGQLVQVLDTAELNPPWQGRVLFSGCEQEQDIIAPRFEAWRAPYQTKLANLQSDLHRLSAAMGWRFLCHNTSHSPQHDLFSLYQHCAPRAKRQHPTAQAIVAR